MRRRVLARLRGAGCLAIALTVVLTTWSPVVPTASAAGTSAAPLAGTYWVSGSWHGSQLWEIPAGNSIDIASYPGSDLQVYSVEAGTVHRRCDNGRDGWVIVDHGPALGFVGYAHLRTGIPAVGTRLAAGQRLGSLYPGAFPAGACGRSGGTHLHLGFSQRATASNLGGVALPASGSVTFPPHGGSQPGQSGNGELYQMWAGDGTWHVGGTGVRLAAPGTVSAVSLGGTWPQALSVNGGSIHHIWGRSDGGGWANVSTGLPVGPDSSVSAVQHGGSLQALVVDDGRLYQVHTGGGWRKDDTGVRLPAGTQVSAVSLGGTWPQALAIGGGTIYHVWGSSTGWHAVSTGLSVSPGATLSATNQAGSLQALVVDNGRLMHVFGGTSGWLKLDTGQSVPTGSPISAVASSSGWPQAFVVVNGRVRHALGSSDGWAVLDSGVPARAASLVVHNGSLQALLTR